MSTAPIAALDLGSNTFRLIVAESSGGRPTGKKVFQHIPRLSERLTPGGNLAPEALARAWEALDDFAGQIRRAGAGRVLAGATMAARLAADGPEFMAEISRRYGWEARIISGEEEAALTAAGVLSGLDPLPENGLIFDIGGRSTEFISTRGGAVNKSRSLALGVVELTESYLGDIPTQGQLAAVAARVRGELGAADFSDVAAEALLVGTAGTVTTVAALLLGLKEYEPALVNNARLERAAVADLLGRLAAVSNAERVSVYGLHPRRADAIVAGLVMVLEIMDHFRTPRISVSDNGLLEGLWFVAAGRLAL